MPTGCQLAKLPSAKYLPNFKKVALVRHSGGGKVVFGVALGLRNSILQYSAVVGPDPVDGTSTSSQTKPPILKFSEDSFHLGVPTLIVGTGLGPKKGDIDIIPRALPPCAPDGVNHAAFYHDTAAPTFHFVASEYGHMDFLDDDCEGMRGILAKCMCKNGPARKPMRMFAAGIVVAFLKAAFFGDTTALDSALAHPELAPIALEQPQSKGKVAHAFGSSKLAPAVSAQ